MLRTPFLGRSSRTRTTATPRFVAGKRTRGTDLDCMCSDLAPLRARAPKLCNGLGILITQTLPSSVAKPPQLAPRLLPAAMAGARTALCPLCSDADARRWHGPPRARRQRSTSPTRGCPPTQSLASGGALIRVGHARGAVVRSICEVTVAGDGRERSSGLWS